MPEIAGRDLVSDASAQVLVVQAKVGAKTNHSMNVCQIISGYRAQKAVAGPLILRDFSIIVHADSAVPKNGHNCL